MAFTARECWALHMQFRKQNKIPAFPQQKKVLDNSKVVISQDYHILLINLQNSKQNNPDEQKLHRNGFDLHVPTPSFRINYKYAGLCRVWINVLIQQCMCIFNCFSRLRLGVN